MVSDIVDGNMHGVRDTYIDAVATSGRGQRVQMEQNRVGHRVELVLLGLYHHTGK